jgi:hypothetical protein
MKQEDIIRMAREAGWGQAKPHDDCTSCGVFNFERFAALVAAAEREACAKVCEEMRTYVDRHNAVVQASAKECAAAIRARGQA